jgi:Zn-dependent protease
MTFTDVQRREDRRISPVFLALIAIMGVSGWAVWTGFSTNVGVSVCLFVVSGWIVSLCLHEYAHARTALHGGDITIGAKGYLTLNPLVYSHAVLSILLPVLFIIMGGIGLPGGAVFIERGRIQGKWKHSLISAAGPLVNLACAVVLLAPLGMGLLDSSPVPFQAAVAYLGFLQVTATLLNLLPVPGLDGYGIVEPWLSYSFRRQVEPFAPFGMLALFGCLMIPAVNQVFFTWVYHLFTAFGVAPDLAWMGDSLFRFWR